MIRKEAVEIIGKLCRNNPIVSANGFISRDLFETNEKNTNFYMIGSMGLASSIALGIALKKSKKKIFVFDGDGNILMNLGSLATIGKMKPKNLIHIIFDNSAHESTGGQPTHSSIIRIEKIAQACGYKIFRTNSKIKLKEIMSKTKRQTQPIMILVKVEPQKSISSRVEYSPITIKSRFMNSL